MRWQEVGEKRFLPRAGIVTVAVLIGMLVLVGSASAATLDVPGTYSTIQAAINAATAGDTINVGAGTYDENVDVDKSVNLVGAGAGVTIVNAASSSDHVFYVTANSVNISGFSVTGATWSGAGIYLNGVNYASIANNTASNNNYGIYLYTSSNNTITDNNASSNGRYGIYLRSSDYNTLANNTASGNNDGGT